MISVENLEKSFGARLLLDGISFRINSRERVGLVGRNGHGKTTLLRLIIGEERPDEGQIVIPKNYRLGYVRQHIEFSQPTVLAEGVQALPPHEKDHHWKVAKILAGLGFSDADLERPPEEFSGGFQVRLNLAKALVAEPDLLLLDEPTNYLDIASIRWVQGYLVNWPHELMVITNDRSFMDGVVTHILGLHRRKVRKIEGDTQKYYDQIAQDEEIYEKTRLNDERRRKEVQQFITRFRAKARLAGLVQSRLKTLAKMDSKTKLDQVRNLEFVFRSVPFNAKQVATLEGVQFGYPGGRPLIRNLNLSIGAGERVAVIGKNGRGKTTLLKLMAGVLKPRKGSISYHPNVVQGFYEQTHVESLVPSRTVEEEILYSAEGLERQKARNICGAMLFSGDDALKPISILSGGEKARVMLGKLIATPSNLLLLDEPTNHLDMDACDALIEALDSFEGTLVLVTHNELFLHALADRLVIFRDQGVEIFEGGYGHFLQQGGWDAEETQVSARKAALSSPALSKQAKKELRRKKSNLTAKRAKTIKPLKIKIDALEGEIEFQEKHLTELSREMERASQQNRGERISKISIQINQCQEKIEQLFDELEAATQAYDSGKADFDRRLADLEENFLSAQEA
ncbi:MAG: ATP-binding cassette domain-containing protein [Desulfobacterales bacterium]